MSRPVDALVPRVLRAPMRSRLDEVDHGAAVTWALERGVVGVGGRLPRSSASAVDDLASAVEAVAHEHGERVAARLERFAHEPTGSFAWTREDDALHVGRVEGEWELDPDGCRHDLVHVRRCSWVGPVPLADVPGPVLHTFGRGGRNLQRVHGDGLLDATERAWLSGRVDADR